MRKRYYGLDFLRGTGVLVVIIFHSAFYHYHDLYDIDFNDPPAAVTVIGLLLMFAGLFGMISGASHTVQSLIKVEKLGFSPASLLKYRFASGVFILLIAYLYFLFTGPGIVNFSERSMDRSLFIQIIQGTGITGLSIQRILYIDSLVMIGINIILLGLFTTCLLRLTLRSGPLDGNAAGRLENAFFWSGIIFFIISYGRIPLYDVYIQAMDQRQWSLVIALNWLVNKNNPVMPFFSFALMGGWIGCLLAKNDFSYMAKKAVPAGLLLLAIGIAAYIDLPDTMLERSIDPKWYSIMTAQLGLFLLLMVLALRVLDFGPKNAVIRENAVIKFVIRFGVAGLTPFFLESVISELIFSGLSYFMQLSFSIGAALIYGTVLAFLWGIGLIIWEKGAYRFSIEYCYGVLMKRFGGSEKELKLKGGGRWI